MMTDANDPEIANTLPEARRAEALAALDRLMPLLCFVVAVVARLILTEAVIYPGPDDPAFYLKVADNLAAGRGLTIDAIWAYLVPFAAITHPSNEYWMPLPSLVLAPFFAVFGSSFQLAQVIGAFVGALLVPLTWLAARAAYRPQGSWRGLAFFAALLVAVNPLLVYQSVTVDSSVYFSLLGAAALLVAALPATTEQSGQRAALCALAAGLLAGLAYLARSDGLYLVLLLLLWVWWTAPRDRRLPHAVAMAVGAGVVIAPWLLRNELTFGAPFPTPAQILALVPDYPTLFHYGPSAFWDGLAAPGLGEQIALRWQGLSHNLYVLLVQSLFPIAIFGLLGFRYLRSAPVAMLGGLFGLMLLLVSALAFPVLTMHGVFYHAVGAFIPFLTVLSAYGLFRVGQFLGDRMFKEPLFMGVALCMGGLVLVSVQLALAATTAAELHRNLRQDMDFAQGWLTEAGAVAVMSNQPYSLHYETGLPTIALPAGDPPAVAQLAAQRYGVGYVVGFGRFGQYPDALAEAPERFTEAARAGNVWIYRIQRIQ